MTYLKTIDGKRVSVERLIEAARTHRNPPNTGTKYTQGNDLYFVKSKNGEMYFFKYFWSMWQGVESNWTPISIDDAEELFNELNNGDYSSITKEGEANLGALFLKEHQDFLDIK